MVKEQNPFNKIHRLIDTFEEFSKFLTVISIRDFIDARAVYEADSRNVTTFLMNKLYAPTLGTWHEFLYRSAKYLAACNDEVFSKDIYRLLGCKEKTGAKLLYSCRYKNQQYTIRNIQGAMSLFTQMRNDYAHGATPGDETCEEDHRLFFPLLNLLMEKARFLNDYTLEATEIDGVMQPVIRKDSRHSLVLYPFMVFTEGEFYYFNDAKLKHKEKLTFLSYYTARKVIDVQSYQFLKKIFPEFDVYEDELNLRKQRLLDTVIGRDEDSEKIENMVLQAPGSRVLYIFGDPGIGKSAAAVYLNEYYFSDCIKALHMFVHNEAATLQPETVFKSIAKPLMTGGLLPPVEITTSNPAEIKKMIDIMLQQASETAKTKDKKIIIIIDGLDEAYNTSEHLYNLLPATPPPRVNIIYFSRRKEEIYSKIYRSSSGWIIKEELKPLKKEAIRAILWQAISKYTIDEKIVDKVYKVSQGNPLYLSFLVNAILEERVVLSTDMLLPRDIIDYYDQLITQIVKRNPQLPIIETALVFSVCFEAINQEQIKKILKKESIEHIILSIKTLSEIIRPMALKGYQKKYKIFHKSIADFMNEQFADTAKEIEQAALFSVIPEEREEMEAWFRDFLEGKKLSKERDEKNLSLFLNRTETFLSAYNILVKKIAAHPKAPEIIRRCYDIAVSSQNLRLFYLINDCFLKIYEVSAGKYIELVTRLNRQYPKDENLKRHIIDALILLRFSDEHHNRIIDLVIKYMLDYSFIMAKSKRFSHIQVINTISGFARFSDTFTHLKDICAIIMNTRTSESIPGKKFKKIEKLLSHLGKIFVSPCFTRFISELREKDNKTFITRGNESYRRLLFKGTVILLKMPRVWIHFCRVTFSFIGLILKNGVTICLEFGKRIRLFGEILQRSFPLIFTSAENPVMNPMGVSMITGIEELLRTRFKMINVKDTNFYDLMKNEVIKGQSEIVENFSYFFSIVLIPLLKVLWNYSKTGLEVVPDYSPEEKEKVRKLLHLLKAEESITRVDEEILFNFLSTDDAWRNYFAMLSIIIQGNDEFHTGKRILKRMLEQNPYNRGEKDEDAIIERLRIYRQYFSIHSYLIRRAADDALVEDMEGTLAYCLDKLQEELTGNPQMIPYFVRATLFNRGDPFNPLLPVGIYQGKREGMSGKKNKLDLFLKRFLQIGAQHPKEVKIKLADKLFNELLSLSLFYPGLALRSALGYYKDFPGKDEQLLEIVIEKIHLVDLMMPGYLEPSVNYLDIDYDDIKKRLLECKESYSLDIRMVEKITNEIRVFAWHECITTMMVFYHEIRDFAIKVIDESFKKELSLPLLFQRLFIELLEKYFSKEINEKAENFFRIESSNE